MSPPLSYSNLYVMGLSYGTEHPTIKLTLSSGCTTVSNAERTKFLEPFLETLRPKQAEAWEVPGPLRDLRRARRPGPAELLPRRPPVLV